MYITGFLDFFSYQNKMNAIFFNKADLAYEFLYFFYTLA